jgi:hypothetical protein
MAAHFAAQMLGQPVQLANRESSRYRFAAQLFK